MRVFKRTFPSGVEMVIDTHPYDDTKFEIGFIDPEEDPGEQEAWVCDGLDANEFQYLGESLIELSRKLRK